MTFDEALQLPLPVLADWLEEQGRRSYARFVRSVLADDEKTPPLWFVTSQICFGKHIEHRDIQHLSRRATRYRLDPPSRHDALLTIDYPRGVIAEHSMGVIFWCYEPAELFVQSVLKSVEEFNEGFKVRSEMWPTLQRHFRQDADKSK